LNIGLLVSFVAVREIVSGVGTLISVATGGFQTGLYVEVDGESSATFCPDSF